MVSLPFADCLLSGTWLHEFASKSKNTQGNIRQKAQRDTLGEAGDGIWPQRASARGAVLIPSAPDREKSTDQPIAEWSLCSWPMIRTRKTGTADRYTLGLSGAVARRLTWTAPKAGSRSRPNASRNTRPIASNRRSPRTDISTGPPLSSSATATLSSSSPAATPTTSSRSTR